jgi:signal transduction histidine kinase
MKQVAPRRRMILESAFFLILLITGAVSLFGLIIIRYSASYLSRELTVSAESTTLELSHALETPLYVLSDESAVDIAAAYLRSGRIDALYLESYATGVLIDRTPSDEPFIGPYITEIERDGLALGRLSLWFSTDEIRRTSRDFLIIIVAISGIIILVIIGAGSLMYRLVVVKQAMILLNGIREIGRGNYSHLIPAGPYRDVNYLVSQINDMARNIREKDRALQDLNDVLEEKVEERSAQVREASEKLRHAERMVSIGNLVTGISHELNTPLGNALTAITYLEHSMKAVKEGSGCPDDVETCNESIELIHLSLDRAIQLMKSFRELMIHQESGERSRISLRDTILDSARLLSAEINYCDLDISVQGEDIIIDSFPSTLWPIITNLIYNAAQHAYDDAGPVIFHLSRKGARIRIVCEDRGRGMEAHILKQIFEPFYTTRRGEGKPGLGLYIVQSMVTSQLGGSVRAESEPGSGTRIILEFDGDGDAQD